MGSWPAWLFSLQRSLGCLLGIDEPGSSSAAVYFLKSPLCRLPLLSGRISPPSPEARESELYETPELFIESTALALANSVT